VPALNDAVKTGDPALQAACLRVLAKLGAAAEEAVPSMAMCLKSPDKEVQREAAVALTAMGPAAALAAPTLVDLLAADETCNQAIEALVSIGKPAVPSLRRAIDKIAPSKDSRTRLGAVMALEKIGPDALGALNEVINIAFNDPIFENKEAAQRAAKAIQRRP